MNNTILRLSALSVAVATILGAGAQQKPDLTKQIELEKEVVIVEKKATKKNQLPTVAPQAAATSPLKLQFSDNTVLSAVPADIPTMMPYGYRTLHNFNDARGYFDFGGGTAANFTGSFGYRIIDTNATKLALWVQHNSTWAARNQTNTSREDDIELILDWWVAKKAKQKFNDNLFGVDLSHDFGVGKLNGAARFHIDQFNYYGGITGTLHIPETVDTYTDIVADRDWDNFKQNYSAADLSLGWEGALSLNDVKSLNYHAGIDFGYAGYSKALSTYNNKGAREVDLKLNIGADYTISDAHGAMLDITAEYNNFNNRGNGTGGYNDITFNKLNKWLVTLAPRYRYTGGNVTLTAGVNIDITNNDAEIYRGAPKVRFSPQLTFDAALARGFGFFANVWGGRQMGRISDFHDSYRYYNPNAVFATNYTPVDASAGFNIGPFAGFDARVYGGYGITKLDNNAGRAPIYDPRRLYAFESMVNAFCGGVIENVVADCGGMYFGAEVHYKYRSLLEASVKFKYAPQDDGFDAGHNYTDYIGTTIPAFFNRSGKTYRGYSLDEYGSTTITNIDVKVTPISKLALNVGLDVCTGRGFFNLTATSTDLLGQWVVTTDTENIINLRAGARYQFNKTLALWLTGDNLLGRRYDPFMNGLGAQRFTVMGGVALTF